MKVRYIKDGKGFKAGDTGYPSDTDELISKGIAQPASLPYKHIEVKKTIKKKK